MPEDGSTEAAALRARRRFPRGIIILPMLALIALAFVSAVVLSLSEDPAPKEEVSAG